MQGNIFLSALHLLGCGVYIFAFLSAPLVSICFINHLIIISMSQVVNVVMLLSVHIVGHEYLAASSRLKHHFTDGSDMQEMSLLLHSDHGDLCFQCWKPSINQIRSN